MPPRKLTPDEVAAMGLSSAAPKRRKLSPEEVAARGLGAPDAGTPSPTLGTPEEVADTEARIAAQPPLDQVRQMATETAARKEAAPANVTMGGTPVDMSKGETDQLLATLAQQKKNNSPETQMAGVRSVLGGLTGGHADEIAAAFEHPVDAVKAALGAGDPAENQYRKAQKSYEAKYDGAAEQFPGGNVVGALAMPLPGVGKLKGASKIAGIVGNAALGRFIGETGASHKPGLEAAADAIPGTLKAGATGLALGTVAAGAGAVAPKLRDIANARSIQTAGGNPQDIARLRRKGLLDQVAQSLLNGRKTRGDFGVTKTGTRILSPLSGATSRYNRVQQHLTDDGAAIGEAAKGIDAAGVKVDMSKTSNRLVGEVVDPLLSGPRVGQGVGKKLFGELEEMNSKGSVPFGDAVEYRRKFAPWIKHDSLKNAPYREGLNEISGGLGTDLNAAAKGAVPELAQKFSDANKNFGTMREIEMLAEKGLNKSSSEGLLKGLLRSRSSTLATTGVDRTAKNAESLSKVADGQLLGKYLASQTGASQVKSAKDTTAKKYDETKDAAGKAVGKAVSDATDDTRDRFLKWLLAGGGK